MNIEKGEIPSENIAPEPIPEKATDMEMALFLNNHIDNPCEVEVSPGQIENIRYFYLAEAQRQLPKMTNSHARELLELKIEEYKKGEK